MKYYAVIDTNVIVSSVLKKNSLPGEIIDFVINGEIIPLLNQEILSEYQEVLSRREFGFSEADVTELIKLIKSKAIYLQRLKSEEPFKDPDDAVFYEIALYARQFTQVYLITGNKKHFPIKPFVVSPREMLDIIADKPA